MKALARRVLRTLPVIGKIARQRDEFRATVNLLWQPPGHFYSPIPALEDIRRRDASLFAPRPMAGISLNETGQLTRLDRMGSVAGDHGYTTPPTNGARYALDNRAFGAVDALVWAAMLRTIRPARVIEVGSGHSTAVLMDTIERHLTPRPTVTLIEPYPALVRSLLRPGDRVRLLESGLQDVPLGEFDQLQANDVLFIDSTHVSKTGSDVNYALFDILPRLASGVYVHIHDVLDGFEYPREYVYQGRAWNEAYLVRAFLQYNSAFEIALWPSWLARTHPERLSRAIPLPSSGVFDVASLWLRKV
jgi:hypothetical protein